MQQVKSLRRMGHPLHCHKQNVGNKEALSHGNMSDSYFPVVIKSKILFWSPVDVFLYQSSYEQVSKMVCFTALCLSFQTWSYLLVQCDIPSRRLGSQPLSELGLPCDETQSSIFFQVHANYFSVGCYVNFSDMLLLFQVDAIYFSGRC